MKTMLYSLARSISTWGSDFPFRRYSRNFCISTSLSTETPAVPVVVPDEGTPGETQPAENEGAPELDEELPSNASSGGSPVDDVACISAGSFSYVDLEEKLKQIPSGLTVAMPSARMFEVVETV